MADYIRRDTLLEDIDEAVKHRGMGEIIGQTLRRYILRQPAADVAEVVRCKECLLRGKQACAMYYRCGCGEQHTWETDDDFCSWGIKTNERAAV